MRRTAPVLLVVDGDAASSDALTHWLYSQGFNAVVAASCLEARAVLEAMELDGLIGNLALTDGSLFELAQRLRAQHGTSTGPGPVVIGYAEVDVRPPPELDLCFVTPIDRQVLGSFLSVRFGRTKRSGEHARMDPNRSVPAARPAPQLGRRR